MSSLSDQMKSTLEAFKKKNPTAMISVGKPTREETEARLAARKQEREAAHQESLKRDAPNLAEMEKRHAEMQAIHAKGKNWQYADREQNLTADERKARAMESGMTHLGSRIEAIKKAGYKHGGKINLDDCSVSTHEKNSKHNHSW